MEVKANNENMVPLETNGQIDINADSNDSEEDLELKVVGSDSNEIHFRVKMTTQMGKLKNPIQNELAHQ